MENIRRIFTNRKFLSSSLSSSSSSSSLSPFAPIGSIFQYQRMPVVCCQPLLTTCSQHWSLIDQLPFRHLYLPDLGLTPELRTLTGMLKDEREKPAQSYIGLIATAILESKEKRLLLGDIYKWVLKNYPYFRSRGSGWRNSIRHNLSLNDCFVKAGRSASGKGHYWSIHKANMADFTRGDFRRKKALRKAKRAILKMAAQEVNRRCHDGFKDVRSDGFDNFEARKPDRCDEECKKESRLVDGGVEKGRGFHVSTILGFN